jgi:hypothetical protein
MGHSVEVDPMAVKRSIGVVPQDVALYQDLSAEEQVIMLSMAAMFLFSALGGAWFPLEVAGAPFSTIGHLTPAAWAMDGFQNII